MIPVSDLVRSRTGIIYRLRVCSIGQAVLCCVSGIILRTFSNSGYWVDLSVCDHRGNGGEIPINVL